MHHLHIYENDPSGQQNTTFLGHQKGGENILRFLGPVQGRQCSGDQIFSLFHERVYQEVRDIPARPNRSSTMLLPVYKQVRGRNQEKTTNHQNEQRQEVSLTRKEATESENGDEVHLLLHLEAERSSRKAKQNSHTNDVSHAIMN